MSDNWIVGNLQSAFNTWNDKLAEIWSLITTTPQEFRGGDIWTVIVDINDGLKAVGYGLLVLFFAMSVFQSAAGFRDFQRPEFALRHLIRFVAAKVAVCQPWGIPGCHGGGLWIGEVRRAPPG